jgi:NTE family protein
MTVAVDEERLAVLAELPLFRGFSPDELSEVGGLFEESSLRKGEVLWRAGDDAESLVVVAWGALEVVGPGQKTINRLGPGESLGEVALLTGGTRTATVRAGRPTRLFVLSAEDFAAVASRNAKVLEYLARLLARRLAASTLEQRVQRGTTAIAVVSEPGVNGGTLVAGTLAALLQRFSGSDAVLVRADDAFEEDASLAELSERSPTDVNSDVRSDGPVPWLPLRVDAEAARGLPPQLDAIVTKLGARFAYQIFDLGRTPGATAEALAEVCDVLVHVGTAPTSADAADATHTRTFSVVNLYDPRAVPRPVSSVEPFVLPLDPQLAGKDHHAQVRHIVEHRRTPAGPPLHRLARKIIGSCLGMAFGGGAAFGIAHVGVLAVLEDNDIAVDVVAGTSFGSIVAIGYAAGLTPQEMKDIAARIGNKRTVLSAVTDFTLSRPGLLRGDRLMDVFSPLIAAETFEELTFPCRTVATDIETGERICIEEGRVDDAFRTSCAVPLLWSPVRRDGRTLVDGGIVDPVPAEVAFDQGADACLAVNVVPQLQKGVDTVLTRMTKRVNRLNPFAYSNGAREMPSIFDVVMSSIHILEYELGNFKAMSADVRINIDCADFTWIEFYRAQELIERGEQAAQKALPAIRAALAAGSSARSTAG